MSTPTPTPLNNTERESLLASATQAKTTEELEAIERRLDGLGTEPFTVCTLGDVAAFFGVQQQTVKQWRTEAERMPGEPGCYPLDVITRWRIRRAEARNIDTDEKRKELEREKLSIEVSQRRLKLQQTAGKLVDRDAAKAAVTQLFHHLRNRLEAVPEEMASSVPPDSRADTIHEWKHKIRLLESEIAKWSLTTD